VSVLFLVLPLALLLAAAAVWACLWAAAQGQFDDLDTPAIRVALDDDAPAPRIGTPPPHRREQASPARE
jgi:cbb3-type cytochrome oxidase maturation protein